MRVTRNNRQAVRDGVLDAEAGSFHLDKRIPIATLVALFLQTAAVIWWASAISQTVQQQGREIELLSTSGTPSSNQRISLLEARYTDQQIKLTEWQVEVRSSLNRISDKLDALSDKQKGR